MKEPVLLGAAVWATHSVTVAYTGVPLNVLVACAIGAYCSFSIEKLQPRSAMVGVFIACLFMGAAFTSVVNSLMGHFVEMVMTDGLQAGTGAIVAFLTRWLLPWLADVVRTGKWLKWIPFINRGDRE